MMKVLLISANTVDDPYPVYPLGLDYVASALADRHRVRILDLNALPSGETLKVAVDRFGPEVIGISLRNIDNTDTHDPKAFMGHYKRLVHRIRKLSNATIVLGGSGFTLFPAQMMDALGADYGVIGEGERFGDLLKALERGLDPGTVRGVISASNPGKTPDPWPHPFPRFFQSKWEHPAFYLKNGGMLNLQTKRGCCFRCIYCTYPHIEGRRLRLVPPDEVAQTALDLQNAGAGYLFVTDSAFNADIDHSLAVAEKFRQIGLSIPWGAFFAPVRMPEPYFRTMAKAGLTHVEFGTEALSNPVLTAYQKPFNREQVLQTHDSAVEAGLNVAHFFLLGGPGETPETLDETLTYAERLEKAVFFFFCGMRIYPHTALFDQAVEEGQITEAQDLLDPVFYRSPAIGSDEIIRRVKDRGRNRVNWVIGSGGAKTVQTLRSMYEKGYTGPLWEFLIR